MLGSPRSSVPTSVHRMRTQSPRRPTSQQAPRKQLLTAVSFTLLWGCPISVQHLICHLASSALFPYPAHVRTPRDPEPCIIRQNPLLIPAAEQVSSVHISHQLLRQHRRIQASLTSTWHSLPGFAQAPKHPPAAFMHGFAWGAGSSPVVTLCSISCSLLLLLADDPGSS